jgi:uncharacterized membrane protein
VTGRAVRWNSRGLVTDLGTLPGGSYSQAVSVNAKGVTVGFAETSSGQSLAVRWSPGGTLTELAILPGYTGSTATQISNDGTIVGEMVTVVGSPTTGLGWAPNATGPAGDCPA